MTVVLAIDAGTTSVRTIAFDDSGRIVASAQREFPQYFPMPGRVEHDATEIWSAVQSTLGEVAGGLEEPPAAIGVTNQRETVVAWSRQNSEPVHRAIVWQDRRTASRCAQLERDGALPMVRECTGLVLDPYFSASKLEWMLTEGGVAAGPDLALGTIDSWILWNLTGGEVHATDATNAGRTMLFDIGSLRWHPELCSLFGVPIEALPQVRPSSGVFGATDSNAACGPGVPIAGIAGDQHAALFGQAAFAPGDAKNTYGTGSFVLMNVGAEVPPPADGLLTTVAWLLNTPQGPTPTYALEGAIFATGAAVQWLRDGLGIIDEAPLLEDLAAQCSLHRRCLPGARLRRARQPPLGPVRARHDRGANPRHWAARDRTGRCGGHGLPDPGRGRGHGSRDRHAGAQLAGRRRRLRHGLHAPVPGRPAGRGREAANAPGGHRSRSGLPGRAGGGCVALARCGGRALGTRL